MAQYYTLEEAAQKLGLSTEAFRRKLATEWKTTPRRYPDGATLRFQVREIDDLARSLGQASEAEVNLGAATLKLADDTSSDDFVPLADEDVLGEVRKDAASKSGRHRQPAPDSDVRLAAEGGKPGSSGRLAQQPTEMVDLDAEQKAKPPSSKK